MQVRSPIAACLLLPLLALARSAEGQTWIVHLTGSRLRQKFLSPHCLLPEVTYLRIPSVPFLRLHFLGSSCPRWVATRHYTAPQYTTLPSQHTSTSSLDSPVLAHLPNNTTSPTDHDRPARLFPTACDSDSTTPTLCNFLFCFSIFRSLLLRIRPPPVTPPHSPFSHQRVNLPRPAQPPFSFTVLQSHPCADTREQDDSTQRRSDPTSLIQPLHVLRARSQTDGLIGSRESPSSFTPGLFLSQWSILVSLPLKWLLILPRCSLCD